MAQWVKNLTAGTWVAVEVCGFTPQADEWVKGSGVAAAVARVAAAAQIPFLAWKLSRGTGAAIK